MFCPSCGAEQVADAAYCHRCGKSLALADSMQTPNFRPVPLTWVFWVLMFCAASSWLAYLLPLLAGRPVNGHTTLATVVWTAGPFAYFWKKKRNQGWLGFGIGALCAVAALAVQSFSVAYVRMHGGIQGWEDAPK